MRIWDLKNRRFEMERDNFRGLATPREFVALRNTMEDVVNAGLRISPEQARELADMLFMRSMRSLIKILIDSLGKS